MNTRSFVTAQVRIGRSRGPQGGQCRSLINLTYLPVQARAESLAAIDAAMKRIAGRVRQTIPRAQINEGKQEGALTRLLVRAEDVQTKIEIIPVLRGCVYDPELRPVSEAVEDQFGFAEIQVVSFADLYAGKRRPSNRLMR